MFGSFIKNLLRVSVLAFVEMFPSLAEVAYADHKSVKKSTHIPATESQPHKKRNNGGNGDFNCHFASLRSSKINMHVGPGMQYPVEWVLVCKKLPVVIVAEFGQWRKICLFDGTTGWIHKSMLSTKKTRLIVKDAVIFANSSKKSEKLAKARQYVVVEEIKVQKGWVKIQVKTNKNIVGWVKAKNCWDGSAPKN
ncbi:MAG: hypothetical protein LBF72_00725 [Holosporales bacterium]|jgi:SH3-like domain-containing protein|nr:hypothetical protein [Holosporales bacterium]